MLAYDPFMVASRRSYSLIGSAGSDSVAGASDISSFSSVEFGYSREYWCDVLISGVAPGTYRVTGERSGFLPQAYGARPGSSVGTPIEVTANRAVSNVRITT